MHAFIHSEVENKTLSTLCYKVKELNKNKSLEAETHLIGRMLCLNKKFPQLLNSASWSHINIYMKNMFPASLHFWHQYLKN
jgi:hypothetical protein